MINEHFEPVFNTVMATQVINQSFPSKKVHDTIMVCLGIYQKQA